MTIYAAPPTQNGLVLNSGDQLIVGEFGSSRNITINAGGQEIVNFNGLANDTTINNGGVEDVNVLGRTNNTIINAGGVLNVETGGLAVNVKFGTVGGILKLGTPLGLNGNLTNWHVGDVVDLLRTHVTAVSEMGSQLTVTYGNGVKAIILLVGKQQNTHVTFHSDGHGGTDLVLTPVVGVPHQDDHGHHFFS